MSLESFTEAYIEAAQWLSLDGNGHPFDEREDLVLSDEARDRMERDAATFYRQFSHLFTDDDGQSGYDFALARCDKYMVNASETGGCEWIPELTEAAMSMGTMVLEDGRDGYIYIEKGR
jgi:hypothetical protein